MLYSIEYVMPIDNCLKAVYWLKVDYISGEYEAWYTPLRHLNVPRWMAYLLLCDTLYPVRTMFGVN